jgi:hypothetical protein
MSWKPDGQGGFSFIGAITEWLRDFQKWYAQDTAGHPEVSESAYIEYLTLNYASLAKAKWEQGWFGKRKANRLNSFMSATPDGTITVRLWDLLDYIAEELDADARLTWSHAARGETKQMLKIA